MINPHSIKFKAFIVLLIVLSLVLLFQTLYIAPLIKNNDIEDALRAQEALANQIANDLEFSFQQAIVELETIAALPALVSLEKAQIDETLSEMNAVTQFFNYYFVLDEQGTWLAYPSNESLVGRRIPAHNMDWVIETLNQDRTIYLDVVVAVIDELVSGFATPIRNQEGKPLGLLRGVILVSEENTLLSTIQHAQFGERGYAYIVASNGVLIAHPQIDLDPKNLDVYDYAHYLPVTKVIRRQQGTVEYEYQGETWMAAYHPIPTTGWGVVVQQPKADILQKAQREANLVTGLFIMAFLFSTVALTLIIHRTLTPLNRLVQDVASGTSPTLQAYPRDEIGQLAQKFKVLYADLLQSQKALQINEERLQLALKGTEAGLWDWHIMTGEVHFGPRWQTMLGFAPGELEGHLQTWEERVHPDDMDMVRQALNQHLAGHTPLYESEYRIKTKSGLWIWIMDRGKVVERDAEGQALRAVGTHIDITERMRTEQRIKHLNAVLRAIRNVNQLIVREKDPTRLLQGVCDNLVETRGYQHAWAVQLNQAGQPTTTAQARLDDDFSAMLAQLQEGTWHHCVQQVLAQPDSGCPQNQQVVVTQDTHAACADCPLAPREIGKGVMTVCLKHDQVHGLLSVAVPGDLYIDQEERALFQEVAGDIAFALHNIALEKEHRRAERALRRERDLVARIMDTSPISILLLDPTGQITFANNQAQQTLGLSERTITQRTYNDPRWHITAYDGGPFPEEQLPFHQVTESGQPVYNVRHALERPDEKRTLLSINAAPLFDETHQLDSVVVTLDDVTERHQAQERIEKLARFPSENPNPVLRVDHSGTLLYANTASRPLLEIWDVQVEHPLPKTWRTYIADVLDAGAHRDIEVQCEDNRIFSLTFAPVPGQDYVNVYGLDITARKQAETERTSLLAQIRAQAHQVQQIIDTLPEGVLLLDNERRVILANPVAKADLEALADIGIGDILSHLGDRLLTELLSAPPKGLWHMVKLDSSTLRRFEVIARAIESGPPPNGWVLVIRDVTQEYQIQLHNQQQERLAAVGQLAAGIAHDFNNIMAVIVLYAQTSLRNPDLPIRVQERLTTISQQAQRATDLINQILDFSRHAVLERHILDLAPFLKELVKLLKRTLPENIDIQVTHGPDKYTINADPTRIQQIFMNLVVNARDAMPQGGHLRIGLQLVLLKDQDIPLPEMGPGRWVKITVSDDGNGIAPQVLPHIFDPFFTTKAAGKGTGLGLAQVHGIVKSHEGEIDVQSQPGQGTTFTIYLPALPVPETLPKSVETPSMPGGGGETILVVEDDAPTREALSDILEELGYQVLTAPNGRQALKMIQSQDTKIALVLSDLVMPEMGGVELCGAIREQHPAIKMIVMTGYPLSDGGKTLLEQGITTWIQKPFSADKIAQTVRQALA